MRPETIKLLRMRATANGTPRERKQTGDPMASVLWQRVDSGRRSSGTREVDKRAIKRPASRW